MIRKEFSIVSASEAGDYFQVLFEQEADNPETDYFLLQCQFEDPDDEDFYIESNDTQFCGHVQVEAVCEEGNQSATTKTSLASAISRADGVMMVFFPMTILELARTAARTSSSQTNPTGFDSLFSACGRGGSSCV